jgi:flagellar assembly protein FliH
MILLSNVIKAPFTKTNHSQKKIIELKHYFWQQADAQNSANALEQVDPQALLEQAMREAERLKQEAEQYCHSLKQRILQEQESWQAEKQQLIATGKEEALAHYQEFIHEAKHLVETAHRQFYEQIESSQETILHIGLKVAERILGKKLEENDDYFVSLVQRAMKEVREQSEVKLYVHPAYYEAVTQQKDELKAVFSQPVDLFIYPDEQMPEGGCMIETPFGRIDASVDTQLQQLKGKLLERLGEE